MPFALATDKFHLVLGSRLMFVGGVTWSNGWDLFCLSPGICFVCISCWHRWLIDQLKCVLLSRVSNLSTHPYSINARFRVIFIYSVLGFVSHLTFGLFQSEDLFNPEVKILIMHKALARMIVSSNKRQIVNFMFAPWKYFLGVYDKLFVCGSQV